MSEYSATTPPELQLALSALTLPLVFGSVALSAASRQFQALGEVSEEIFRGDRLPVLPFPIEESASVPDAP